MDHSPHKYGLQSSLEVMTLYLNPQDESLEGSGTLHRPDRICLICADCERRSREVTTPLKSKPSLGRKRVAAEVTGGVA